MSQFGETLFGGSRFVFWALAPILVSAAIFLPLTIAPEGWLQTAVVYAMSAVCLALALGLANPTRFWWALRFVAAAVFFTYVAYFIYELLGVVRGEEPLLSRRSGTSLASASLGLLIIGYPSFVYMLRGRFTWRAPYVPTESDWLGVVLDPAVDPEDRAAAALELAFTQDPDTQAVLEGLIHDPAEPMELRVAAGLARMAEAAERDGETAALAQLPPDVLEALRETNR